MADGSHDAGIPSLLMQAAQSAAQADGVLPATNDSIAQQAAMQQALAARALMQQQQQQQQAAAAAASSGGGGKKKGPPLRRGKWTPEEEAYANRLIQEFKAGLLPLTDGTTLRTFLSKLLNCDPMRISKKFVGSNCIGKQVFRRRTADVNRLTPDQIQKSRAELSELERRFLERVAQTNRVKSSGVGGAAAASAAANNSIPMTVGGAPMGAGHDFARNHQIDVSGIARAAGQQEPPSPPWLQPPLGFKHGNGAAFAASNLSGSSNRAAAAGRAMLGGNFLQRNNDNKPPQPTDGLTASNSSGVLAELQRRASQQSMLQNALQQHNQNSASNLLAAAVRSGSNGALSAAGGSGLSISQLARNASAGQLANNSSVTDFMLKTGLSRDQLSELARQRGLSSGSLSNMLQRQNSFDALMSLDFQSLQSIDNLANLIQNNGVNHIPESGLRNAEFGASSRNSAGDLNNLRVGSANRMDALLRNLSNSNMGRTNSASGNSNTNLSSILQSMGNFNQFNNQAAGANAGRGNGSSNSLWGTNAQSAASLANLLRPDSSTGLSALRMQDGLNAQRNSSVDDFLSLMAAGDIPHQDPSLLDVPLVQQQGQDAAAKLLAQQQLLQSNPALANALASRSLGNFSAGGFSSNALAALGNKRKLDEMGGNDNQGDAKR